MKWASDWGVASIALLLAACAGQRSSATRTGASDAASQGVSSEALASAPSEPLRTSQGQAEATDSAVAAVQGWLGTQDAEQDVPPPLIECLLDRGVYRAVSVMLLVTELSEELSGEEYTILVPNDRAFQLLSLETRLELFEMGDAELMADILRRHVLRGVYSAADMARAGELTSVAGTRIRVEDVGGVPVLDGAQVLGSRRTAEGMMHELDRVLLP